MHTHIHSFDKDAIFRCVGAESFFSLLNDIYACFDDMVKSAGMWKVEHVGEVCLRMYVLERCVYVCIYLSTWRGVSMYVCACAVCLRMYVLEQCVYVCIYLSTWRGCMCLCGVSTYVCT
jgi:hypothetical protein